MVIGNCCIFKPRCFFLFLCYLQLITLIARQTFDFFGHLWLCILVNFFTILIVIIGIFGGHQYRPGYISIYLLWQLVNIAWNVFIVCFYLDLGPYNQSNSGDYNLVNLHTGSISWFAANGPLCNAIYNVSNLTDHIQLIKPVQVNGCYIDYRIIECVQAGIQILFALNTFFISFFLIYSFSRKPYSTGRQYNHGLAINGHTGNIDATLPPYTINNTMNRPSVLQRSIRSVQSQSLRKNTNRSSTRSTKSHRSARRTKHNNAIAQLPSYNNANYPNAQQHPHYSSNNNYNTLNSNSNKNGYYNTYKSIKSYDNHHSNYSKQYNSTTHLQPDSSSVDSMNIYNNAQTNQGYYESKYSLHKADKEPMQSTSHVNNSKVPPVTPQRGAHHQQQHQQQQQQQQQQQPQHTDNYYDTAPANYHANNSINNYETQSNYSHAYKSNHSLNNNQQDSIYNVYSSNPYNTYGRSATRQQRPSSFSSTASCNSLMDNMITNNPNGNHYTSHPFENVNLRGSPIYMNSETRI